MAINIQHVYTPDPFISQRKQMVRDQLSKRDVADPKVLHAMEELPRHLFIPPELQKQAYQDGPLPIGEGQTISQPYMVAKNAELLELSGSERVLEIGVGCGYQAALLGCLAKEIVGIEWFETLAKTAQENLKKLGFVNVSVKQGDGKLGCPEQAPFDRILVSCASPTVLKAWEEQLSDGGILVYPKEAGPYQILCKCVKGTKGWAKEEELFGVRFVPLL